MNLGFIGVGNMGNAIVNGYLLGEGATATKVFLFDTDTEKMQNLIEMGCYKSESIEELVGNCDFVVIGVKPDAFENVLPEIAKAYTSDKVLISIAAGITIKVMERVVGENAKIIRTMPNTPAMVCEAMTAICRNENITNAEMKKACDIFEKIGKVCEIPEELIHCAIGVSGSSPAYTYMYIDALTQAAVENGMDMEQALICAAQSVLGAAKMVLETGVSPEQLRINVCSPGGATIEAVHKLQGDNFEGIVKAGFQAAVEKSKLMSK
jgi:pyrroline-5-carboxylate reductase